MLVKDEVCTQEVNFKCELWGCKFTTIYNSELIEHNNVEHVVDDSFIYPDSNMETDCPDCDKMFLEDHAFAWHINEEHFYHSNCKHFKKDIPREDDLAGIHIKLCPVRYDGDPNCPFKLYWTLTVFVVL